MVPYAHASSIACWTEADPFPSECVIYLLVRGSPRRASRKRGFWPHRALHSVPAFLEAWRHRPIVMAETQHCHDNHGDHPRCRGQGTHAGDLSASYLERKVPLQNYFKTPLDMALNPTESNIKELKGARAGDRERWFARSLDTWCLEIFAIVFSVSLIVTGGRRDGDFNENDIDWEQYSN